MENSGARDVSAVEPGLGCDKHLAIGTDISSRFSVVWAAQS